MAPRTGAMVRRDSEIRVLGELERSRWEDPAALREAVGAYSGDLLAGSYDEWLVDERERLRELHAHALERLALTLAGRGEYADAVRFGEQLLRLDPLREESCRLVTRGRRTSSRD